MGLDRYTWGRKDFHKCWSGSLAKRGLCLGPAGVIDCTPLSALSFWVSLCPRKHGYNNGREEEELTFWTVSEVAGAGGMFFHLTPNEWEGSIVKEGWESFQGRSLNYKMALAENLCQHLNNKGIWHQPLWRLDSVLPQLLSFRTPWGEFRVGSEALCAPGKLVEQVFS